MRRIALGFVPLLLVVPSGAVAGSLPDDEPRPGPAVLYAPLADAPQLENTGIWQAEPLMVSGADAYVAGEYLYQDFIYDSYGANTIDAPFARPETTPASTSEAFGAPTGDVVYPTDTATYGFDAADLLEFRARLTGDGNIAYRITLNTMLAADAAAIAIGRRWAFQEEPDDHWFYGLGKLVEQDDVILTWGTGAERAGVPLSSSVDVGRNQIEVIAPLPSGVSRIRHYVVVGLWDAPGHAFKPILEEPTATMPGGAHGQSPPPVFNVGFRFAEPMGDEPAETGQRTVGYGHWRDHAQAKALAARDISAFGVDLDLGKLADPNLVESHVPGGGYLNRLYVSHLDLGEGAKASRPMLIGKIQPYAVYVPTTYAPGAPAPLHLHLHSLSASYNQYMVFSPNTFRDLGEERGAFVLSPAGRGPDGWWHDEAEVDVFEAWADLAARYDLDPTRTTVGGYSMGGYGTYRMASLYPDLFSRAFATVGPADENILGGPTAGGVQSAHNSLRVAENLYNIPLLMWNGVVDELVPIAGVVRHELLLHDLGLRHELNVFPADHFLLSIIDDWRRAATFLGNGTVNRDPERVVYRAAPGMGNPSLGLAHDHAYWVSGIAVAPGASTGLVDARSAVNGVGEPVVSEIAGAGADPAPHVRRGIEWSGNAAVTAENGLAVELTDVAGLTVWVERAGIDPSIGVGVRITASGAGALTLRSSLGAVVIGYDGAGTTNAVVQPEDWEAI